MSEPLEIPVGNEDAHRPRPNVASEVPNTASVAAINHRRRPAEDAGVHAIAAEIAVNTQANNDLERLLVEQLAEAHRLAMTFAARSGVHARNSEFAHLPAIAKATNAQEATRFAGAAARLMLAFNDGLRTLQRLRSGGRQTVVVQHVTVTEGAQAIVAGSVHAPDKEGGVGNS